MKQLAASLKRWLSKHDSRVVMVVLVILAVWFYFDFLLCRVFVFDDALVMGYPHLNYILRALGSGRIPLWLPNCCNGTPYYFSLNTIAYIPHWLLLAFMEGRQLPIWAYQGFLISHIIVGGLFMYWFLRDMGLRPLAAGVGGVIFMFCGFNSLHLIHSSFVQAFTWMPLQFLVVRRGVNTRKLRYYVMSALLIALSLAAGHAQVTLYISYLLVAYWCFLRIRAIVLGQDRSFKRVVFALAGEAGLMVAVFAIAVGLCAFFILPSLEMGKLSTRGVWGFREMADQSMPPYYLVHLLVPKFFGAINSKMPFWGFDRSSQEVQKFQGGAWQYWEFGGYAGQLAILAIVVFLFARSRRGPHRAEILFFLVCTGLAIWFMLGRYGGLFYVLFHALPGLSLFRIPPRMGGVFDFCVAVLTAFLVDAGENDRPFEIKKPAVIIAAAYIALYLTTPALIGMILPESGEFVSRAIEYGRKQVWVGGVFYGAIAWIIYGFGTAWGRKHKQILAGSLVLLSAADLYWAHGEFHRGKVGPNEYFADRMGLAPQLAQLEKTAGPFRVVQMYGRDLMRDLFYPSGMPLLREEFNFTKGYFVLYPKEFIAFESLRNLRAQLDLENTGLILRYDPEQKEPQVIRYTNSLARVAFFDKFHSYQSLAAMMADLDAGRLDYKQVVGVLEEDKNAYAALGDSASFNNSGSNQVWVVEHNPESYRLGYKLDRPGVIFVSESYYPGWEVVGGKFPVIRAFGAFIGIVVSKPGAGELTLQFNSPSIRKGVTISVITGAGLLLVVLWGVSRSRRRHAPPR